METAVLLFILIIAIIFGFMVIKKADAFLNESLSRKSDAVENSENVVKIACENPIMLPFITEKIDRQKKEFCKISFYFFTGRREDIEKALENGSCDFVLLIGEPNVGEYGNYEKKISSFIPHSVSEPLTGLAIEPVENQRTKMCVLWNEKNISETKCKLIFGITSG